MVTIMSTESGMVLSLTYLGEHFKPFSYVLGVNAMQSNAPQHTRYCMKHYVILKIHNVGKRHLISRSKIQLF